MNSDYLEWEEGESDSASGRRGKPRIRSREESRSRGRKDRHSPRERIRRIRKTQERD